MRKIYVGAAEKEYSLVDVPVTEGNVSEWFDVEHGEFGFTLADGVFAANNMSDDETMTDTVAVTTITAKKKTKVSVSYDVYAYYYDSFYIYFGDTEEMGGTIDYEQIGVIEKDMEAGDTFRFELSIESTTRRSTQRANITVTTKEPDYDDYTVRRYDGVAKKVYYGVPEKEYGEVDVEIDENNISERFRVTNGGYFFEGQDGVFSANNGGQINSVATTRLEALEDMSEVSFRWKVKTDGYDKMTIVVAGEAVASNTSDGEETWKGSLKTGDEISLTYEKDLYGDVEGECACIYDLKCRATDHENYTTISRARKVVKGYVGHGGVASYFFGHRDLVYRGVAGEIYLADKLSGGQNASCAFFAGGYKEWVLSDNDIVDLVYAFDNSLTRHIADELYSTGTGMSSATAGDDEWVVFYAGNKRDRVVDAYDTHLTHVTPALLSDGAEGAAGASFNSCAVFAGGVDSDNYGKDWIHIYDGELTHRMKDDFLTEVRRGCEGAVAGGRFIVGGGIVGGGTTVDVIDKEWTVMTADLSSDRGILRAETAERKVFFFGADDVVDVFDEELTRVMIPAGSVEVKDAISVGGMAVVSDGVTIEAYDDTLTVKGYEPTTAPSAMRVTLSRIGDYVLLGGRLIHNDSSSGVIKDVECYKLK